MELASQPVLRKETDSLIEYSAIGRNEYRRWHAQDTVVSHRTSVHSISRCVADFEVFQELSSVIVRAQADERADIYANHRICVA